MGRPRKYFTKEELRIAHNLTCRKSYREAHKRFSKYGLSTPKGFYTYVWLREDGSPYYVGKGTGNRGFITSGHGVHCPTDRLLILVQEHPSESDAFEVEKFLIDYYGRLDIGTGPLRNLTEGGENPPKKAKGKYRVSEETKVRISEKIKALWEDPVYWAHMSEAHKGIRK